MRRILVLDFGSQYTQLIARRLREKGVYAEILPFSAPFEEIQKHNPLGIILSGGPASVHAAKSPRPDLRILKMGIPALGICYGMQLLAAVSGGRVDKAKKREYGFAKVKVTARSPLFHNIPEHFQAWMSHGDGVKKTGGDFKTAAVTGSALFAAIADERRNFYGVQFHPEVAHTSCGNKILENFARRICGYSERWTPACVLKESIENIRRQTGNGSVVCALSGGVDSSVAAAIIHRAIGKRLYCIFVDTGLLRSGDSERVKRLFAGKMRLNLKMTDASKLFLKRLEGVADPERKRKIIGRTFIEVFNKEAKRIKGIDFLAQGTLYPDVIESVSVSGPSAVIKSHHNVGGLPKRMKLKLIEPLKFLFKDEVRKLGREMGMNEEILSAHPFPGPGLAIRIIGAVTAGRLEILRKADLIVREEISAGGWDKKIWQAFAVLLPVKSVGVMGDERTYENAAAVRLVESIDGMTADWSKLPHEILQKISGRIVSEVRGINRVVYDITSKPPSTIEWE